MGYSTGSSKGLRFLLFFSLFMWTAMPLWAFWLIGYCLTRTGIAVLESCITIGALWTANPGGLLSAHTPGIFCCSSWSNGASGTGFLLSVPSARSYSLFKGQVKSTGPGL